MFRMLSVSFFTFQLDGILLVVKPLELFNYKRTGHFAANGVKHITCQQNIYNNN